MKEINKNEHTKNSIRNVSWALVGQFLAYAIRFVIRMVFVKTLNDEYLGIEGLFTSIISVLSLTELGFGSAIIFSLYKPISDNDREKILGLMNFYKKVYWIIGCLVLVIGLSLSPFLGFFIKEMPNISHLQLYYCMFVFQSSFSYFFAYKRSFLIANQQNYIVSIIHYLMEVLFVVTEIVILLAFKNYFLYLLLTIFQVIVENLVIAIVCNRLNPDLKNVKGHKVDDSSLKKIKGDVSALVVHQFGSVAVNSTDNLIISKFIGIIETGLYSNYSLILTAVNGVLGQIFTGMTASIGHLNASSNVEHKKNVFWELMMINHLIYGTVAICSFFLINDVVGLAFGQKYLLDVKVVLLVIVAFYLNGMRKTSLLYKSTMGIFRPDKYKAFVEALINLVVSIILAKKMGLTGVFIGTVTSCVLTSLWVEPLVVFKYGFKTTVWPYFQKYFFNILTIVLAILPCYFISKYVSGNTILLFLLKGSVLLILSIVFLVIPFLNTKEFKSLKLRVFHK